MVTSLKRKMWKSESRDFVMFIFARKKRFDAKIGGPLKHRPVAASVPQNVAPVAASVP